MVTELGIEYLETQREELLDSLTEGRQRRPFDLGSPSIASFQTVKKVVN